MKENIVNAANNRNSIKPLFTIVFANQEEFQQFQDETGFIGEFCTYETFSKLLQ